MKAIWASIILSIFYFLSYRKGHNAYERIRKEMNKEKRKGKQKFSLRLSGCWISGSRPGEVSKTPSLGND